MQVYGQEQPPAAEDELEWEVCSLTRTQHLSQAEPSLQTSTGTLHGWVGTCVQVDNWHSHGSLPSYSSLLHCVQLVVIR